MKNRETRIGDLACVFKKVKGNVVDFAVIEVRHRGEEYIECFNSNRLISINNFNGAFHL